MIEDFERVLFGIRVGPSINIAPLSGYVRPNHQLETLQKSICSGASTCGLANIRDEKVWLNSTQDADGIGINTHGPASDQGTQRSHDPHCWKIWRALHSFGDVLNSRS